MATMVQFLGGGTSIEDLSEAELSFVARLRHGQPFNGINTQTAVDYFGDTSKIASVKVRINTYFPYGGNASYRILGTSYYSSSSENKEIEFPRVARTGTTNSMWIQQDASNATTSAKIVSFTTTDGKVHTASDLNY